MFLLPGLIREKSSNHHIIALSITGGLNAVMMCKYLYNYQKKMNKFTDELFFQNEDGEWALHIEGQLPRL
ncbi:hypothetical protein ACFX12_028588 [Malus domestica]